MELVEVPQEFIQDYLLQLKPHSRDQIEGWVKLSDAAAGTTCHGAHSGSRHREDVTTDANGVAQISLPANNLKLWSPDNPKLYNVEISPEVTSSQRIRQRQGSDQIGFRTIEVRGQDILLNGRRFS